MIVWLRRTGIDRWRCDGCRYTFTQRPLIHECHVIEVDVR